MPIENRLRAAEGQWSDIKNETQDQVESLAAKASRTASDAVDSVKSGIDRAKEAVTEMDASEALDATGRYVKETGETVARSVANHPFMAFGLGALSVGLFAWAKFGGVPVRRQSFWDRALSWEPQNWSFDERKLRSLMPRFDARDAAEHGRSLMLSGRDQAVDQSRYLADQALDSGRMLAARAGREPIAALIGIGIAIYAVGSMLSAASAASSHDRRGPSKR